jgi:hypothetical protein
MFRWTLIVLALALQAPRQFRFDDPRPRAKGEQVGKTTGVPLVADSPTHTNYFARTQIDDGEQNEVARDVLRRVLIDRTGPPCSWNMKCKGGWGCVLNPHQVVVR